jgi:hypothetical protein
MSSLVLYSVVFDNIVPFGDHINVNANLGFDIALLVTQEIQNILKLVFLK